jgi:hypothetical protein
LGNAPIIRHPPGGPPVEPPQHRVLWVVYKLRQNGEKLPRDLVLRTGKRGTLELMEAPPAGMRARLLDPFTGEPVASMWDVRVIRHDERGLLLHGVTLNSEPQAWWCLVHSLQRVS